MKRLACSSSAARSSAASKSLHPLAAGPAGIRVSSSSVIPGSPAAAGAVHAPDEVAARQPGRAQDQQFLVAEWKRVVEAEMPCKRPVLPAHFQIAQADPQLRGSALRSGDCLLFGGQRGRVQRRDSRIRQKLRERLGPVAPPRGRTRSSLPERSHRPATAPRAVRRTNAPPTQGIPEVHGAASHGRPSCLPRLRGATSMPTPWPPPPRASRGARSAGSSSPRGTRNS